MNDDLRARILKLADDVLTARLAYEAAEATELDRVNSLYLANGAQRVTYTTVKGTGSCTVATAKDVRRVTLDEGRAEIRALLGQGWALVQDMVLS